jgi:hypothetical protein
MAMGIIPSLSSLPCRNTTSIIENQGTLAVLEGGHWFISILYFKLSPFANMLTHDAM